MKYRYMKYPLASIFCLALAACGGGGSSSSPAASSQVPATVGVADSLVPGCTGANCGAIDANTYSGTGIGVWRYNNTSSSAATINVDIARVAAGNVATLVFSNGSQASATAPASGILASPVTPTPVLADSGLFAGAVAEHQKHDDAHAQMLEKNRAISAGLIRSRTTANIAADLLSTSSAAVTRLSFSPAVDTTRSWIDNYPTTPVTHSASVQSVCPVLPGGRNVVWWVDTTIVSSSNFTAALRAMQTSYCGSAGGLAQLKTLLGDVWGSAASTYPELIKDVPGTLQDVNVVLLNVPASAGWAGYFFGGNNLLKTPSNSSNEALAFFINANQFKATDGVSFLSSTLLHESTHMVNFYQRAIALGVVHDTWLEETSAMMTEDIVTPTVVPAGVGGYNKILSYRLPRYLLTGGNVSYINWPTLLDSSPNYDLGGGFGAFLNRRYGLSIYQQLVTSCSDGPAAPALTSYACLDGLIKANGGTSFSDEFARFGATAFGQFPAVGPPAGYGYPSTVAGAYTLQTKDISPLSLAAPASLTSGYTATSHTYQRDTIAAGKTSYVRNGVVVPAKTSLMVIIK